MASVLERSYLEWRRLEDETNECPSMTLDVASKCGTQRCAVPVGQESDSSEAQFEVMGLPSEAVMLEEQFGRPLVAFPFEFPANVERQCFIIICVAQRSLPWKNMMHGLM
jgi:hypothetical protein